MPKTKSGKILLSRDILLNPKTKSYGDISTIQDKNKRLSIKKTINQIKIEDHEIIMLVSKNLKYQKVK